MSPQPTEEHLRSALNNYLVFMAMHLARVKTLKDQQGLTSTHVQKFFDDEQASLEALAEGLDAILESGGGG